MFNLCFFFNPSIHFEKLSMDYYYKIGLKKLPQVLVNGFPLSSSEIEPDVFEESIITKIMQLTPEIQMAVYKGQLHDSINLLDWLMNKEVIMPRLNSRILSSERSFLEMNEIGTKFLSTYILIK
jgi:UDP-glucose:glycoprotein glucosyltransferase